MKTKAYYESIIAEAQASIKAIDEEMCIPSPGSLYWVLYGDGGIKKTPWNNCEYDFNVMAMGNAFLAASEAQKAADLQRARATVERAIKGSGLDMRLRHTMRPSQHNQTLYDASSSVVKAAMNLLEL